MSTSDRRALDPNRLAAVWSEGPRSIKCPKCRSLLLSRSYHPADASYQTWVDFRCQVCDEFIGQIGYTREAFGLVTPQWIRQELARQVKERRYHVDVDEAPTPAEGILLPSRWS